MKANVLQLALLLPMVASVAICQETKLSDSCDLSIFTDRDTKSFLAFDKELRAAIRKQDPVAMAFLVKFPLRVNSNTGKYSLDDPAALESHFQEVFPQAVRNAVLNQDPAQFMCRDQGVMYGNGEVWVNIAKFGFAIEVVNLETSASGKVPKRGIEFTCQTDRYRIVIDLDASRVSRYREWNRPHPLTDNPDLEFAKGKSSFEGAGLCSYPVWTFTNHQAAYRVEGLGCFGDAEPGPPKDAKGRLVIFLAGQEKSSEWCY